MDNLFSQGKISDEALGILFIPAANTTKGGGLTFAGYDDAVTVRPPADQDPTYYITLLG